VLTLLEGTYAEFGEFVSAISAKQGVDKIDKAVIINQLIRGQPKKIYISRKK